MKPNTLSGYKTWFPLLIWWLFWTIAQTLIIHRFGFQWSIALADACLTNLVLALAGFVTQSTYKFYNPGSENRFFRLIYGLVLSLICVWLINNIINYVFQDNSAYIEFINKATPVRTVFALLMISFVTIVSWLFSYIEEKQKSVQRKTEAEILLRAAELSSLRQQLQPHFLFNSLNSISALAGSKPEEARKMIQLLSDFLRGTLKKDDEQSNKIMDEITHLQLYLDIEKVRFGYRLNTIIEMDEKCKQMEVPTLILQPVVENAIKFGLYNTIEAIEIKLKVTCAGQFLHIEVTNPFDENESPSNKGEGFGLNALQRRLEILYNRSDLLETSKNKNLFITRIKIPQQA